MTNLIARPIFAFATSTLALMLGVSSAGALEDVKVFRGVLVLEGKIQAGDFEKVRNFLGNKANFEKINGGVFAASRVATFLKQPRSDASFALSD